MPAAREPEHAYPLDQPIHSDNDVVLAQNSSGKWTDLDAGMRTYAQDRAIEIAAFRLCGIWRADPRAKHCNMPVAILVPSISGQALIINTVMVTAKSAYEQFRQRAAAITSDVDFMGSVLLAEHLRHAMEARFIDPWPTLPVALGADAVLDALMTPDHAARRQAALLDRKTRHCPASIRSHRL